MSNTGAGGVSFDFDFLVVAGGGGTSCDDALLELSSMLAAAARPLVFLMGELVSINSS